MPPLVLVVEDEAILGDSISQYLAHHAYATAVARSGEQGLRLVEEANPDVAIVDLRLPGIDGLEVLRRVREISPTTVVILMTAHSSVASAVDAMKRGAFDYLTKPLALEELRIVVDKAVTHLRQSRELAYLKARSAVGGRLSEMLGESPPMQALRAQVQRAAALESPADGRAPIVLIRGETGTGKELVARALHYESPRASGPFVEINCAAIPATLLEAELFGHERGAYTDAKTAKAGLFEAADGGTLLLDEIGHMDVALQAKLLRVTEDMTVRRVGGLRPKAVNVRIVAATNRDLEVAVAEGAFRADLYYRLNVLTLEVPPLRDRDRDVILLARSFTERTAQRYGLSAQTLTPGAEAALLQYPWPGNVRELAHVVERAVLLHKGGLVDAEALHLSVPRSEVPVVVEPSGRVLVDFSAGHIVLDEVERDLIRQALQASGWNRTEAAQRLGISRDTLRYRIEKYGLEPPATGP
jgi:two-component system, NtrC family, response regulator AtoC